MRMGRSIMIVKVRQDGLRRRQSQLGFLATPVQLFLVFGIVPTAIMTSRICGFTPFLVILYIKPRIGLDAQGRLVLCHDPVLFQDFFVVKAGFQRFVFADRRMNGIQIKSTGTGTSS